MLGFSASIASCWRYISINLIWYQLLLINGIHCHVAYFNMLTNFVHKVCGEWLWYKKNIKILNNGQSLHNFTLSMFDIRSSCPPNFKLIGQRLVCGLKYRDWYTFKWAMVFKYVCHWRTALCFANYEWTCTTLWGFPFQKKLNQLICMQDQRSVAIAVE